jgi:hypothetical protein
MDINMNVYRFQGMLFFFYKKFVTVFPLPPAHSSPSMLLLLLSLVLQNHRGDHCAIGRDLLEGLTTIQYIG